jgi:acyl dehydratase
MQPNPRPNQFTPTNSTVTPASRSTEAQAQNYQGAGTPAPGVGAASVKGPMFTGEQTAVAQFAKRINAGWHTTAESVLEMATACAEADKQLSQSAKKALIAQLPFDRVTFVKLSAIGNDVRLRPLIHQLPSSFSTLYELTKFDEEQLTTGLKTGAINPHATRQEIIELKSADAAKRASKSAKSSLEKLKSHWEKASDIERQSFREWCSKGCPDA